MKIRVKILSFESYRIQHYRTMPKSAIKKKKKS